VAQSIDPAIMQLVLQTTGSKEIQDLGEIIRLLKERMVELAQEYKDGQHSQEQYKDSSDILIKTLKEQEEILRRATTVEQDATRAALEQAESDRKLAEAATEATAKIEEQTRAEQVMAEIADEVEKPLKRLTGEGDGESGEGGLKGVAGAAIKAEKAMAGLASGHIGRIGQQLEGVLPLLGGPAGMGLAIGALVIGVHDLIPKLKEWFDTFQEGSEEVKAAEKAIKDFDVAQRSIHEDMRKRSLADIDKQIEALEGAERGYQQYGGRLNEEEQRTLAGLRGRSRVGHEQEELRKTLGQIGPTKTQREMGQAVKEAITESGGLSAIIGDNADIVAQRMVQSAMAGDRESIETLKRWSPEFASMWKVFDPDAILHAKQRESGEKTIADVEKMTGRNVEKREKSEDRAFESTMRSDERFNEQLAKQQDKDARENEKAMADAARLKDQLDRQAAAADRHAERESTPQAMLRRQRAAMEGQMIQNVQGMAPELNPEQVGQVARDALRQLPATGGNAALAIQQAIMAAYQRGLMMQQQDMQRMQMFTEIFQSSQ